MSAAESIVQQEITRLAEHVARIKAQRDEAYAVLRDIIRGADMMLEPALNIQGAMRGYIQEIKRVAQGGLT